MPEPVTIFTPPSSSPPVNPSPAAPVHTSSPVRDGRIADGVRSDPPQAPWQEKWQRDYDALTKENDWRNPDLVIFKNEDGSLGTRPRDRSASDAPSDAGDRPQPQPTPAGQATSDGSRLKVGEFELSPDDIKGLLERKSLEDGRRAQMPRDASAYKLDLPADFKLPENSEWVWDTSDAASSAMLDAARQWAFKHGLDQPAFSSLLSLYAQSELVGRQRFVEARAREIEQLGSAAAARVDAVSTFLESQLGSDLAGSLRSVLFTAKSVQAIERIMRNFTSQGMSGNPGLARDGGDLSRGPQKVSEEQYQAMSFHERMTYASQFDQSGR
jgi:hypothetical protein